MFCFCIYNPEPGSEGWDCAALLSLWSLFPGGFHPRQGWMCILWGNSILSRSEAFDQPGQMGTVKCLIKGERTWDTPDKAMPMRWDSAQVCFQLQNIFLSLFLFLGWICSVSKWQMATSASFLVSFCMSAVLLTHKLLPLLGESVLDLSLQNCFFPHFVLCTIQKGTAPTEELWKGVTTSQMFGCKNFSLYCRSAGSEFLLIPYAP